ncbi:MAG: DUF4041 domain-containing protein [Bacillus sp. (in: firmicutes)]
MENQKWYMSLWFIILMFIFWFLIVPLIIGIILLKKYNKLHKESLRKEQDRLSNWEKRLNEKSGKLEQLSKDKQKEISLIDLTQSIKLVSKIKEKEEELRLMEFNLSVRRKEVEEELNQEKEFIDKKAKHLEVLIAKKQREISIIKLTERIKMIPRIREKEQELLNRENELNGRINELEHLKREIKFLRKEKITLEDEVLFQSFGFYEEKFSLGNSEEYMEFLDKVTDKQKQLVKENRAIDYDLIALEEHEVSLDRSKVKQQIKLAIRAFNSECDASISKVKFYNVESAEKKIRSSFYMINSLNKANYFSIAYEYLQLKLEELFLVHEYKERKQEEKEEQRRINELIREEKRAQKELEEELSIIKKEEQHLLNVISQRSTQLSDKEINKYKTRLEEIQRQKEKVDYRIKNTRAGYVYVVSNIGCFGEDVYKIGMTRRLEPMDRIKELGGASVPFHYDVHAMIFSEDAPALEASLHKAFHHRRVNRINERKEFFRVTLSDIKRLVHQNHSAHIEFTKLAEAKEFRETQVLEKQFARKHII